MRKVIALVAVMTLVLTGLTVCGKIAGTKKDNVDSYIQGFVAIGG